ncbi:MAG: hypothetical protein NVS3B26_20280 [Mycobacteriales bacterium]
MSVGYLGGDWDYTTLPGSVVIGLGCYLEREGSFELYRSEQPVGLRLGNGVQAFTWTAFNVEPTGTVLVGDDTVLVGAVFMCAERIEVGSRVTVSYQVTIADSDFHPMDPALRRMDARSNAPRGDRSNRPQIESRPVRIGDDVRVGIGAIILKGVTIGAGATIGAGSVVTRDVPTGAFARGNPAVLTPGPM